MSECITAYPPEQDNLQSLRSRLLRSVSILALGLMCVVQIGIADIAVFHHFGPDCPPGSMQARPTSTIYIDEDTGEITHVEYVGCDGKRTVGRPSNGLISSGIMYHYQAYNSYLDTVNIPSLTLGSSNTITINLDTPAKVEVRDGYTGTLLASLPSSGPELTQYTVSSSALSGYSGHLIVVDAINTSNSSYTGTASIEYP